MTRTLRSLAVLLCLALLATACGTMLDDDERRAAIRFQAGGAGGGGGELGDDELAFTEDGDADLDGDWDDDFDFDDPDAPAGGAGGDGDPGAGSGGDAPGGQEAQSGQGGPGAGADEGDGGQEGQRNQQGRQPSGPLTASDTGVTPEQIVIANASDISGPVPGIFESSRQAVQAYAAYVNSRGGIHGRQLQVLNLDTRADASENRNAAAQACERAFAMVGSMSAFDMGGAAVVDECGIPDLTAIPVTEERQTAENTFGAYPQSPDLLITSNARFIAQRNPEAVKRAALVYTEAPTTRADALKRKRGYEQLGYEFVYETSISAVEANMAPFVLEMRRRDVEYVTGVMPYQQIVRLHETMAQQNFSPTVAHWDSVVYDPGFIQLGGQHVEGAQVFINTAMLEEINANEEMQRYAQWLRRIAPNARPTYFGLYSWSAAALFEEVANEVGPELTREAFLQEIRTVREWDGRGLHAPHNIGQKRISGCNINLEVRGGEFRRVHPSSGFDCQEPTRLR